MRKFMCFFFAIFIALTAFTSLASAGENNQENGVKNSREQNITYSSNKTMYLKYIADQLRSSTTLPQLEPLVQEIHELYREETDKDLKAQLVALSDMANRRFLECKQEALAVNSSLGDGAVPASNTQTKAVSQNRFAKMARLLANDPTGESNGSSTLATRTRLNREYSSEMAKLDSQVRQATNMETRNALLQERATLQQQYQQALKVSQQIRPRKDLLRSNKNTLSSEIASGRKEALESNLGEVMRQISKENDPQKKMALLKQRNKLVEELKSLKS